MECWSLKNKSGVWRILSREGIWTSPDHEGVPADTWSDTADRTVLIFLHRGGIDDAQSRTYAGTNLESLLEFLDEPC